MMLPGISGIGAHVPIDPFKITAIETHASSFGWNGSEYIFNAEVPPHKNGDLLLLVVCLTGITAGSSIRIETSPPPSGWMLVAAHEGTDNVSQTSQLVVFRKMANVDNISVTTDEIVISGYGGYRLGSIGVAITGVDDTTPMEPDIGTSAVSMSDPSAPSINLTAGKRLILVCLACDDNNAMGTGTYPGIMDGVFLLSSASPNHFGIYLGYTVGNFSDGTYYPGDWDISLSSGDIAVQISCAVRKKTN